MVASFIILLWMLFYYYIYKQSLDFMKTVKWEPKYNIKQRVTRMTLPFETGAVGTVSRSELEGNHELLHISFERAMVIFNSLTKDESGNVKIVEVRGFTIA